MYYSFCCYLLCMMSVLLMLCFVHVLCRVYMRWLLKWLCLLLWCFLVSILLCLTSTFCTIVSKLFFFFFVVVTASTSKACRPLRSHNTVFYARLSRNNYEHRQSQQLSCSRIQSCQQNDSSARSGLCKSLEVSSFFVPIAILQ